MAEKRVRIKLPYVPGVLEDDKFVGDNGKTYLIKRGEYVEVPKVSSRYWTVRKNSSLKALKQGANCKKQRKPRRWTN